MIEAMTQSDMNMGGKVKMTPITLIMENPFLYVDGSQIVDLNN
jgi:hypothetical protein